MALTALQVQQSVITLLRDKADNNLLLDAVQFTPEELTNALELMASQYNVMAPSTSYKWQNLPLYLVVLGAARFLMLSESFLQLRNQVTMHSDHNEAIGIDDKHQFYLQLQAQLNAEWSEASRLYKDAQNAVGAFGYLPSGYVNVSRNNS